jgi:hypothetical protein
MMNKIIEENRIDEGVDDIVVQQKEKPTKKLQWFSIFLLGKSFGPRSLSIPDLFVVGLVMKLGGCSVKWNTGLILGFGSFFEVIMFFGLGYLSLGFCMAEQYYGYAILISPLGGYLVGCSGLIELVFHVAVLPPSIARCFHIVFNFSDIHQPLVLLLVYLSLFCSFLMIQSKFWSFISFSSCVLIALFAVFLFGSVPQMDYRKYAIINSGKICNRRSSIRSCTSLGSLFCDI